MNHLSADFVANYEDADPISLEDIQNLQTNNIFFVTNKITKNLYAYDAKNWFIYISENRRHPITKKYLTNQEFWDLYLLIQTNLKTIQQTDPELFPLITKAIEKYHSKKILFQKTTQNNYKIIPVSPLFNLTICKMKKINENDENENIIHYHIIYNLIDSRNKKTIFKNISVTVQCPNDVFISFGF